MENQIEATEVKTEEVGTDKYRYVIEALLFLTYAAFGMTWAAAGSFLKPFMKEMHLSMAQASFMTTSVSIAKIFGPALAGFVSAKLGFRWAFMVAAGLVCLGILAPISPLYVLILLARFAMGVGGAMVVVYFTPIVMKWFSEHERIAINGLNFVSINCGMSVALFATSYVQKALGDSWQKTLVAYSLVSVLLAVLWLILGREKKTPVPVKPPGEKQLEKAVSTGGYAEAFRDMNTWKLAITYMGALSLYITLFTYFPTFYKDLFGQDAPFWVLKAPALAMFSGIPAAIVGIALTKRTGLRTPFLKVAGIVLIPAVLGMFLVKSPAVIIASSIVTGFALFIWASPFFTIPQELPGVTAEKAGYMMGLFWAFCYMAATFNVWFVGFIIEKMGGNYNAGFIYITVVSASLLIGSFLIPETGPGRKMQEAKS